MISWLRQTRFFKVLYVIIRPMGVLVKWVIRKTGLINSVKKEISQFGEYYLVPEYIFSDFKNWSTGHNDAFDALILATRGKSCVFDLGAYIGLTTLPISRVMEKTGVVHAFEPAQKNRQTLVEHLRLNDVKNVVIDGRLVGDQTTEETDFFESDEICGMNSLVDTGKIDHAKKRPVGMVSIDAYCEESKCQPDLIKIDVEGAELMVLNGALTTIRKSHPVIFLSVHPRHLSQLGVKVEDVVNLMINEGYQFHDFEDKKIQRESVGFGEYILTYKE